MDRSSKGFAHIILLLVIVIVAIGGVGYLMYQNGQLGQQVRKQQAEESDSMMDMKNSEFSTTPDPTTNWETYNFVVISDKDNPERSISYPSDWTRDIEYYNESLPNSSIPHNLYLSRIRLLKSNYIFEIYYPSAYGMDFCFHPDSEPEPPFYTGPSDYDFKTREKYKTIESDHATYVRGEIPLPALGVNVNRFYLEICNYDQPMQSVFRGFITYYGPNKEFDLDILNEMDQILRTYQIPDMRRVEIPTPSPIPKITYTDKEFGYKITYPETWRFRRTYGSDIYKAATMNDIISGVDLHRGELATANVGVNVLNRHGESDIEQWVTKYDLNYPKDADKQITTHKGSKAILYSYKNTNRQPTTSNQTLYFLSGNNAYRIFSWEHYEISEDTQTIVNSFIP